MQEQILLAGSTEKSRMLLQTLLPPGTNPPPRMCMSGAETRRALGEDDWQLLVINTPLSDESGIDLAIDAASHTATSVLMLVKAELADQVQAQLENYGVFVVAKPVARPLFDQAIRYAAVLRNRLMTVCAEKAKLEKKLADVRVIDRAKCLLIQYRGMTEEQAHRAIEHAGVVATFGETRVRGCLGLLRRLGQPVQGGFQRLAKAAGRQQLAVGQHLRSVLGLLRQRCQGRLTSFSGLVDLLLTARQGARRQSHTA